MLVTGATGFTGTYVVRQLLRSGVEVKCFVRASSDTRRLPVNHIELAVGDLYDRESLRAALSSVDMLVNIASLGFGNSENIVGAAVDAGVSRALFISTTAVFTKLNAPSKAVRMAAEEQIRNSRLLYTILRPTMIYGSGHDRNMSRLIRYLHNWPVIPVFGTGDHLQRPVYVGDVALAIAKAIHNEKTSNKSYNISGASLLTYNEVINTICAGLGRRVLKMHIPARPVITTFRLFERLPRRLLPIKAEQIERLNEDKVFDHSEATQDFGFNPLSFADGIMREIKSMRLVH